MREIVIPLIPEPLKGKDGNIITPEEVRNKLKELKEKNRLSVFDLKDTEYLQGKGKDKMQWNSVGGLSSVSHDTTLSGDGTLANPLTVIGGGKTLFTEIPTGSGTSFTLSHTPVTIVMIVARGQILYPSGANQGYSILGTALTTNDSWSAGDILATYYY